MADVKALQDITSEQTEPASADLLFIEKAGVPAKITFDALTGGIVDDYEEALKITETAGSGNAYTLNLTPDAATYHDGQRLMLRVDRTNTDAVTLAVDGQSAKAVQRYDTSGTLVDLVAGQWQIGQTHIVYYNGTQFVCITPVGDPAWKYAWHPFDMTDIGDGSDGLLYDHSVDGDVGSIESGALDDGYDYMFVTSVLQHDSGSSRFLNVGAYSRSWVTQRVSANLPSSSSMEFVITIPLATNPYAAFNLPFSATGFNITSALTGGLNVSGGAVTNLKLDTDGSPDFSAGTVHLFKRKVVGV